MLKYCSLLCFVFVFVIFLTSTLPAQAPAPAAPQAPQAETAQPQHPPAVSALSRLGMARKVYMKRGPGNSIPFNVISSAFEAWPRFTLVRDPEQADIIVEVSAPEEGGGVAITTIPNSPDGRPQATTSTTRSIPNNRVEMVIIDVHNRVRLWSASEQPKSAMKQRAREDHLVEAAQALFTRFHVRLEPPEPGKN